MLHLTITGPRIFALLFALYPVIDVLVSRSCQFVMWKNDRFFEQRKKAFTPKIAAALLKNGKAKVKGLYSEKTGKTYDATVLLADTGDKYVNYRVERKE